MSNTFLTMRFFSYASIIISSCVVLGLAANFANLFLPHIHRPFTIFSLVVPCTTIVVLTLILMRSMPIIDTIFLFILWVLWLAMGAWSSDVIGHVECFSLGGLTTPTKNGTMSLQVYCYEMKSIEAFSWANFGLLLISFLIIVILANRAQSMGNYAVWNESMSFLPWFNQYGSPYGNYGYGAGQPMFANGQMPFVINQNPGHSVVIQPNGPGGVPQVTQVPGTVTTAM